MNTSAKTLRFILAGSILAALHAHATVIDWKASSTNTLWATGTNWVGNNAPADDLSTDIARFNQTSYAFQPNAGTRSIAGIQIGDGATATAALTLTSTNLSIGASGLTISANAGAVTLSSGTVTIGAAQSWANSSGNTLTANSAIAFSNLLTFNGGSFTLNTTGTGTGGARITNSSTVFYGGTTAIFGTGALELNSGALKSSSGTTRTLVNNLTISGSFTLGDLQTANNGGFIFNTGTEAFTAASTLTSLQAVTFGTGLVNTGNNAITFQGPGLVTLQSTATFGSGAINIGNSTFAPSGSLGGSVTGNSQNALGTGSYVVNYGGRLSPSGNFSTSNVITINNGGTYNPTSATAGITAFAATSSIASGGTLNNSSGQTLTITTANVSLPTAGVLFNNSGNTVTVTGAYPAFTGTTAFGGTGSASITTSAVTTTSGAQTLAFNQTGNGGMALSGLTLGGNLTVAGSGNHSLSGLIPQGNVSGGVPTGESLGTVTESGSRSITVNMAPTGLISVNQTATGWTGGTTVKGGILATNGNGNTQKNLGSAGVTLDGGFIRNINGANNNSVWQDAIAVTANGGGIESFSSGNGQENSFTGAITGSGPLTLRYGGATTNLSSVLLAPAVASGYNGTITLATSNGLGRVQFNANSLNSIAANGVVVGSGVVFGVDALATLTGNIGKFSTTTESILALENLSASAINLNTLGKDIRIGNTSSLTYSGALTPFGSTYNITPGNGGFTLSIQAANIFTGAAKNLDVRAGAMAPGASGAMNGTLSIQNGQNYAGTTVVSGTIKNSLAGGGVQGTILLLTNNSTTSQGDLSGTSSITLNNSAALNLEGTVLNSARISSASVPITVKGGSTLTDGSGTNTNNNGVTDRIVNSATLTLGGDSGGGTFSMALPSAATHSQTLASLAIGSGSSILKSTNTAGAANIGNLIFTGTAGAGFVHNTGGAVAETVALGFTPSFTNAPTLAGGSSVSTGADGDAVLVGAYLGNPTATDFIKAAAGAFAAPAYTTQNTLSNWGTASNGGNILVAGAVSGTVGTGTINSLKTTSAQTIALTAANKLTIKSGMILNTVATTISGGTGITSGTNEMIVNDTTGLSISSAIVQNATPANLAFTKLGVGTTILSGASNAIGDIYALAGALRIDTNTSALGVGGTTYLQGGSLVLGTGMTAVTFGSGYAFNVGAAGGTISGALASQTFTLNGNITLNGALTVNNLTGGTLQTATLGGTITGAGTIVAASPTQNNSTRNILVISGSNAGFTGGIRMTVQNGSLTAVRLENANAAGTGAIVSSTANSQLYFGTGTANATLANDIVGVSVLANWATSNPVTLTGKFFNTNGLTLQGYSSGGATSELVLAGTTSISGSALSYNWSATPTTSIQNFVNGQGGMTLGSTGTIAGQVAAIGLTNSTGATQNIDNPTGGAALTAGALGFVRFSGAQSFIPGAVGPGYLAALSRGGSGNDGLFGYLLTTGSTYALPEGKSLVIGSLGTGTQVGGTLGAAGTGTNTAILTGSPKLTGFSAGDVNVHANAVGDTQSLNLLARNATDTLQIGTVGTGVVFTPTYGDSGATSSVTLMTTRTGATTINKSGLGTVEVVNAHFNNVNGAADSAKAGFTLNVNAGTLKYTQVDSGTNYAGVNVASSATLAGTGSINGAVTVSSGGFLAPGVSAGTLGFGAGLTIAAGGIFNWENNTINTLGTAGTNWDVANVTSGTTTISNTATTGSQLKLLFTDAGTSFSNSFWDTNRAWDFITGGVAGSNLFDTSNITVFINAVQQGSNNIITGQGTFSTVVSGSNEQLVWTALASGNNSKLWFGGTEPTTTLQTTSTTQAFGRVMLSSAQSAGVTLNSNGSDAATTNGTLAATGDATTTTATGLISTRSPVNATLSTGSTGVKAGTVTVTNAAADSAGASQGNDNGVATINVSGTVLANRTLTATALGALGLQHVGATYAGPATTTVSTLASTAGDDNRATRVTLGGGTDGSLTVAGSATVFNTASQAEGRGVSGSYATAGAISGSFNLTTAVDGSETATGTTPQTTAVTYSASVFNGTGKWTSGASGDWGTHANWTDSNAINAAPGTFGASFDNVDTATLDGTGAGPVISLNGTSPSVKNVAFSGGVAYTVAPGSGGTLKLKADAGSATVSSSSTVTQTISALVELDSNTVVSVTNIAGLVSTTGNISQSGSHSLTKVGTGTLDLNGANQAYTTLNVNDGTANVNGTLGATPGTAVVSVTDTAGGVATKLRFGSVSQTLSSLTIGAGATVIFTSGVASGAFTGGGGGGGGKAPGLGGGGAVVPEPGTLGLLLVGALGMLNRRRRQGVNKNFQG